MQSQSKKVIPYPEPSSAISPHQVWPHLSTRQQHQVRQTLTTIVQEFLPPLEEHPIVEESSDAH